MKIDYLDEKYKGVKGLPRFVYKNGYCIFVEEEYWGHANPVEVIYTLLDENGNEVGSAYKGDIRASLKEWSEKYGKKTLLKD